MASNWYEGILNTKGGLYTPPVAQPSMSVEDIYRGIIPSQTSGLTTRSVNTVPVPNPVSYALSGQAGIGPGGSARGSVSYMPPVMPNQPNGSIVAKSGTERLPAMSANADLLTGYAPAGSSSPAVAAINDASGYPNGIHPFAGYQAKMRPVAAMGGSGKDIQLQFEPGDVSGQRFADSEGRTFRTPSGKVYSPGGGVGAAPVLGGSPQDMRGREPQRQAGLGGLLGSLFGGQSNSGGLFSLLANPAQQQAPRTAAGKPIAAPGTVINSAVFGSGGSSYGSDKGQITAGLKPGERSFNTDTGTWGLKTK